MPAAPPIVDAPAELADLAEEAEETAAAAPPVDPQLLELQATQRQRDGIHDVICRNFASRLWWFAKPAWLMARLFGLLRVGIDQLIPLFESRRGPDGSWQGSGLAQFLVPVLPFRGWVRVRAKIRCPVSTKASLYFDRGSGFRSYEPVDLAAIHAGETVIDRMVPVREPAVLIRFDPILHRTDYTITAFSLEPISSTWAHVSALWGNFRRALLGSEGHRPSILLGLKLIAQGKWRLFHFQMLANAEGSSGSDYALWQKRHKITVTMRQKMRQEMAGWHNPPGISVILPVYNVAEDYLRQCIDSVVNQIYPHWELCIADDASPRPHVKRILDEYAAKDPRIKVIYREKNGNISAASNSALELATGEFTALLDHDDELAEHALFRVAEALVRDPSLDMIYTDEDKLTPDGKRLDPFFKPDWSPEYFLACMYVCHLGVYRTELIRKAGGWRSQFDSSQDYDLVLRIVAGNPKILHIPDVLYHWRMIASSAASGPDAKPQAHDRAEAALAEHLQNIGRPGTVESGPSEGFHRVRYHIIGQPLVSIVIPSACRALEMQGRPTWLVLECVASIRRLSTYRNIEIIVLDDNHMPTELAAALEPLQISRIPFTEPFNFSKKVNLGAQSARGEHLLILNDDVRVISPDWIESMLEYSQWPEIGAVGGQLLFPNDTLQHTGVMLLDGNPGHPFYQFPADHPGYYYSNRVHRNWVAVTAACMMTRRDVFDSVGGFDLLFPLNFNDVDYCLKVRDTGRRIVYMPYAQLYHHESLTKSGTHAHEIEAFRNIWAQRYPLDPYYNPNLTMLGCDFRIA